MRLQRAVVPLAVALVLGLSTTARAAGPQVAIDTTMGRIVVELDPVRAPESSRNFLRYVAEGHYDGTLFHRVVEGFVIQGGGLTPDLEQKAAHAPIVNEARNGLSNVAGSLAMAREAAIDSATAQFYINVVDNPRLDHVDVPPEGVTVTRRGREVFVPQAEADKVFGYAVFGRVVEGLDVVERIRHVAVRQIGHGEDTYENVPVEPIIIQKAVLLPPTH
jgi:cyclophilin family peptidyl-prolyl cis-trans isomerase